MKSLKRTLILAIILAMLSCLLCSCSVKVTYEATEGGLIIGQSSQSAKKDGGVATFDTVMAKASDGYRFVAWDDGLEDPTRTDSLSKSGTFTAIFEKIPIIKITYTAIDGGMIKGTEVQNLLQGDTTTQVEAIPYEGYEFVGWDDGLESATRTDIAYVNEVKKALFVYDDDELLVYEASEGGTITGIAVQDTLRGESGTEVTAVADEGYRFVKWDDGTLSPSRTDIAYETATYKAIFTKIYSLSVWGYSENEGDIVSSADGIRIDIFSNGDGAIIDAGTEVTLEAKPRVGYSFVGWSNGETDAKIKIRVNENTEIKPIFEKRTYKMPLIEIETENYAPVNNTSTYVRCTFNLSNTDDGQEIINLGAQIRGRGNTSWSESPKKPYRIKLDHPVSLFGFGKARDWTLIANYCDKSLVRNYLAYSVALQFSELHETSKCQLVEVYLNSEYLGVYLLCEQIEVDENRVEVSEDTSSVDTGYLVELDGRGDGTYVTVDGGKYVVKYPDPDTELTEEHKAYIQDYLTRCLSVMRTGTYEQVCALMDVESFAQAYIVFELFKCADVDWSSFFLHKDAGGKLECGPIWDFDLSVGNINHSDSAKPSNTLYVRNTSRWFNGLFKHKEFENLVRDTLKEYAPMIERCLEDCFAYIYALPKECFDHNFLKWDILGIYIWSNPPEIVNIKTWKGQVEYVRSYLKTSLAYLLTKYK